MRHVILKARFYSPWKSSSLSLPLLLIALQGCVKEEDLTPSTSPDPGSVVTTPVAPPSETGAVYLKLTYEWENVPGLIFDIGTCRVPEGSAIPTAVTCNLTAPEGQLYFSKLHMTAGTNAASSCAILIFRPFYYRASTAAGFLAPWEADPSAVDCTDPTEAGCYNGPAVDVVPSFPDSRSNYIAPQSSVEMTVTADAANGKGQGSNRWTSNGLTDRMTAIPNWYIGANTMQDYVAECRDAHYELNYQVTVILSDEDATSGEDPGGPTDHFSDWND